MKSRKFHVRQMEKEQNRIIHSGILEESKKVKTKLHAKKFRYPKVKKIKYPR